MSPPPSPDGTGWKYGLRFLAWIVIVFALLGGEHWLLTAWFADRPAELALTQLNGDSQAYADLRTVDMIKGWSSPIVTAAIVILAVPLWAAALGRWIVTTRFGFRRPRPSTP